MLWQKLKENPKKRKEKMRKVILIETKINRLLSNLEKEKPPHRKKFNHPEKFKETEFQ